jgi:hypothetical protein
MLSNYSDCILHFPISDFKSRNYFSISKPFKFSYIFTGQINNNKKQISFDYTLIFPSYKVDSKISIFIYNYSNSLSTKLI